MRLGGGGGNFREAEVGSIVILVAVTLILKKHCIILIGTPPFRSLLVWLREKSWQNGTDGEAFEVQAKFRKISCLLDSALVQILWCDHQKFKKQNATNSIKQPLRWATT
jgi:hypothetical protein